MSKNVKHNVSKSIAEFYKDRPREIFPGKGLFLGLSWVAFTFILLVSGLLIYLVTPRLLSFGSHFYYAFLLFIILFIIVLGGGLLLITLSVTLHKDLLYPHGGFQITMRILPPIVVAIGKMIGISRDKLLESIIDVQNSIFLVQKIDTSKILILLPHCLQNHDCDWKITWSVENCKRCGKCPIGGLCEISEEFGISLYVATGGTIARRVVKEVRPSMIMAVACPRDLASGMVDVYPIPVFGILNDRPKGPCFDTVIDTDFVKDVLTKLLGGNDD